MLGRCQTLTSASSQPAGEARGGWWGPSSPAGKTSVHRSQQESLVRALGCEALWGQRAPRVPLRPAFHPHGVQTAKNIHLHKMPQRTDCSPQTCVDRSVGLERKGSNSPHLWAVPPPPIEVP